MNLRRWFSAGSAGSIVVGLAIALGLVSAGITREAPIGRIAGSVIMQENGRVLPDAEIVLRPVTEPKVGGDRAIEEGLPRYRYARTEEDGTFAIRNVAAGKYMIEAYGSAHDMEPKPVEVVEGRVNEFRLELKPRDPFLDLYASQSVFQPTEPINWDLHGFVEDETVKVELFRLRFDAVLKEGTLYGALAPLARRGGDAVDPATLGDRVLAKDEPTAGRDVEGTFRLNLKLDAQKEGIYWVRCSIGGLTRGAYFSVTRLGLVTKRIGTDILTFATRLDTGDPVPGTKVGYVKSGVFIPGGTTGRDGLARFRLPADLPDRNSVIIGREGDSTAFVDFWVGQRSASQNRIYIYTDRSVYRPGDEISFKGVIRTLNGSRYRVPPSGPVEIEIRDPDENLIERQTLTSNAQGSFHSKFTTLEEATPGSFRIEAKFAGTEYSTGVMVAAYRKPNYSIKVRPEKEHYIRGERVRMIVECQYYFGGPVGGAKIEGAVFRSPLYTYEYDGETESYSGGGEYFTDVEAVTDENGRAVVEFDSRLPEESAEVWTDAEYELSASVSDDAGAYFEGRGKTVVSAGEFSVGVEPSHWVVEKNAPFEVRFETTQPGKDKPAPAKQLKVVAGYEFWDGQETEFKVFAQKSITTGSDGKATVVITPFKGGNVVVKATAQDGQGNEIVAETSVWSSTSGSDGYRSEESETFVVRLDRQKYAPGQTAKLLIQAPKPGATALVTIEGEKLYRTQIVKLEGASTTVDLKVEDAYAPNVFVSVCYVQDKQFVSRQRTLMVELGKRVLNVKVTSDKPTYLPGETANYAIETRDESGRPVPADVSLAVVDESIFAIREDDTDLVEAFYPMRYNEVETSYSFTTLYLDGGDKSPPEIEIRRIFRDTAYWNPVLQTDASGRAQVSVKLPDNLTTWRATVQAIDGSTAVGEGISKAVARKPLMVRLQTPSFYVSDDVQRLPASVTNQTGQEATVNVEITLVGVTTTENRRKTIRLKDGQTGAVEWPVTVGDPGEAVYTARAWVDATTNDGVEAKVRILPKGRKAQEAFSGDVTANAKVTINVDANADRTTGGVTLALSPSIAAPLFQSLDDLVDFPYGCVEQTMSRFMPATVVMGVVRDLQLPAPKQAVRMPEIVAESYSRLGKMQNYSGGWGWWEMDEGDTYMTAYVLEGVYRARQAGYPERSINLPNALKWAETRLKSALPEVTEKDWIWRNELDERVYLAYAIALHGKTVEAAAFLNQVDFKKLTAQGSAMAILALNRLGPDFVGMRTVALDRMKYLAKETSGLMSWDESYWGVESTARCLQALAAVEPFNPKIDGIVRYLMLSRRGSWWYSTRDTAIALLAIADYMKARSLEFGDATMSVLVNGRPLANVAFTAQSIADASKRIEIPMRLLVRGPNTIEIRKVGGGAAFYSAELTQTIVEPQARAFSNLNGVKIERTYHKLVQERRENGTMKLVPGQAVTQFNAGDIVRCVVKITSDRELRYLMIEDPVPSNCRVLEREDFDYGGEWNFWWISLIIRDDRVAYFARNLGKGTFELEYNMRAEQTGTSTALPSSICEMYDPSKRAWSGLGSLEVSK